MEKTSVIISDNRNYGIDLLRIISMIMIPILHILGHGKILGNATPLSMKYEIAYFIECACYCAVNCYALISGYVGYGKKHNPSKIINLYFQVIFYTVTITAGYYLITHNRIGTKMLINTVIPFAFYNPYWYFTSYFILFFFMPFIDKILDAFSKTAIKKILIISFIIFSLIPVFLQIDFAGIGNGYTFLWIAYLYMFGGYIKKYGIDIEHKSRKNLLFYFVCVFITWFVKFAVEFGTKIVFGTPKEGGYLINYTSPTVLLSAIFLLLFCANLKCNDRAVKFIKFFAPVSFGVYLLHEEPLIVDNFIKNAFVGYLSLNPILMILAVLGTALLIWLVGSLVDKLRILLFELLKVKNISKKIENILQKFLIHINV